MLASSLLVPGIADARAVIDPATAVADVSRYASWPEEAELGLSFRICVRDDDPAISALLKAESKSVNGRQISVHTVPPERLALYPCHATYFSEGYATGAVLRDLADKAVLTISPQEGFATSGGLVELREDAGRMRIIIDKGRMRGHSLGISAPLLDLAREPGE
jgi:hypothetical protein